MVGGAGVKAGNFLADFDVADPGADLCGGDRHRDRFRVFADQEVGLADVFDREAAGFPARVDQAGDPRGGGADLRGRLRVDPRRPQGFEGFVFPLGVGGGV